MTGHTSGVSDRRLTCTLAKDMSALDISRVLEILDMPVITRVPRVPPAERGVVNVRGVAASTKENDPCE
jgi:chemotaxis signal transduction protein